MVSSSDSLSVRSWVQVPLPQQREKIASLLFFVFKGLNNTDNNTYNNKNGQCE